MVDFLIAVPLRHILQVSSSPLHNLSHAYASSARSGMAASLFLMLLLTGSYHQLDIFKPAMDAAAEDNDRRNSPPTATGTFAQ
jgi:hypothetical protein